MLRLIQLEQRIVLDAAGAETAAETVAETLTDPLVPLAITPSDQEASDGEPSDGPAPVEKPSAIVSEEAVLAEEIKNIAEATEKTSLGEDDEAESEEQLTKKETSDATLGETTEEVSEVVGEELVIIDGAVDDLDMLTTSFDPELTVHIIEPSSDGIAKITEILAETSDISAIHIFSHGSPGVLSVGSSLLHEDNVIEYAEQLEGWKDSLTDDADIMIYGCNVTASESGEDLIKTMADLTGADVAASSNATGSAFLGGDWELESQIGEIDSSTLAGQIESYDALLAEQTIDFSDSPGGFGSATWTKDGFRFTVDNLDVPAGGYSQANMVNRTDWAGVEIHLDPATDPGMLIRESWPNARLELRIQRVDGQDFTFKSIWVGSNNNFNTTVTGALSAGGSVSSTVTPGEAAARYVTLGAGGSAVNVSSISIQGRTEGDWSTGFSVDTFVYELPNQPPEVANFANGQITFNQAGSPVNIDVGMDAVVTDSDSTDFNGGNVTARITANEWASQDVLQVGNVGNITVSGTTVSHAGTAIGTITSNGQTGNDLVVTLNGNATIARVQDLVRALQYDNTNDINPDLGDRTVQLAINDGDGSPPKDYSMTVNMEPIPLPAGTQTIESFAISGTPKTFTDGGFTFTVSGGYDSYLQTWSNDPHGAGYHISDNTTSNLTSTIARSDNSDFTMHSMLVSNYDNAGITIRGYNNGSVVATNVLPGGATQRVLFNGAVLDQIQITGQTGGSSAGMAFVDDFTYQVSNIAPTVTNLDGDTVTFTEGGAPVALDAGGNAAIVDSDSSDFNQGQVTASVVVNEWSGQDVLQVGNVGNITVVGTSVSHSGTPIGTISSNGLSGNDLVIELNSNATAERVQSLVRALQYSNSDITDPDLATRTVRVTVSDGDLAPPTSNDINVKVAPPAPSIGTLTENFNGASTGSTSFVQGDYTVTVTGGTSTQFQSSSDGPLSPAMRVRTSAAGQTVTVNIVRTDGADFEADSLIVGNPDNNANLTVVGRNNSAAVAGQSHTLAAGQLRQVDFSGATLDQILITGQTDPNWSIATYFDQLTVLEPNQAPTIDLDNSVVGSGYNTTFDEGSHQGTGNTDGVLIANNPAIADFEDDTITQLVVTLDNHQGDTGERVFLSGSYADVTYSLDSATQLTITNGGTASAAQMAAVLSNVRYQNNDDALSTVNRTLTVLVSDARGSSSSSVSVAVSGTNDSPTAVDDSDSTGEGTALVTANVLTNDTDVDLSDTLSVLDFDTTGTLGLVTNNGDGTFNYDPNGQFETLAVGESATDTFEYTVTDGNGGTDIATFTVTVTGVNNPPTAVDNGYTTDDETAFATGNVLTNDIDPDGTDVLVISNFDTTGTIGLVTNNGDGTFDYDPGGNFGYLKPGETATDTFMYTVSDNNGGISTASVTITITVQNEAPVASGDDYSVQEDSVLTVPPPGVLANDTDSESSLSISSYDSTSVMGATVIMNSDGSFTYDPTTSVAIQHLNRGETVVDTFSYTAIDQNGATSTATVTITITGQNEPIIASDIDTFGNDMSGPQYFSQSGEYYIDPALVTISQYNPFTPGFEYRGDFFGLKDDRFVFGFNSGRLILSSFEIGLQEGEHGSFESDAGGFTEYDIISIANRLLQGQLELPDVYRRIEIAGVNGVLVGLLDG